jgi:single-stranded DNA-binding protein
MAAAMRLYAPTRTTETTQTPRPVQQSGRSEEESPMSFHALVSGELVADPARRTGAKADFATGTLRVATDDSAILASMIAFGEAAETLLSRTQGTALAVSGRAKLTAWIGKDGGERHGVSIVVEQITSAAAARRAEAARRRETPMRREPPPEKEDPALPPPADRKRALATMQAAVSPGASVALDAD